MAYCILKTQYLNDEKKEKSIEKNHVFKNGLYEFLKELEKNNQWKFINGETNDLLSTEYDCGKYLVYNENTLTGYTVDKFEKDIKGYLYNSKKVRFNISEKWELILNGDNITTGTECNINNVSIGNNSKSLNNLFSIKRFDSKIEKNTTNLIIGKRGSGKSTLVVDLLEKNYFKKTTIICPSEKYQKFYTKFYPDINILYDNYLTFIKNIMQTKNMEDEVIIFDDCFSSKGEWLKDKHFIDFFHNHRYYNKTLIFAFQYPQELSPEIRLNFDNVFLLAEDIVLNKERLYDHYGGVFPYLINFTNALDFITQNYGCMVINQKEKSNNFSNKIFKYKADLIY